MRRVERSKICLLKRENLDRGEGELSYGVEMSISRASFAYGSGDTSVVGKM
jgi:hypothetical protein